MMKKSKAAKKVAKVMGEYGKGELHSGKGGPVVKSQKQAVAIAYATKRAAASKKGKSK